MSGEKTEQATPKKLKDTKKKGQVPRSKELASVLVLVGALFFIINLSQGVIGHVKGLFFQSFQLSEIAALGPKQIAHVVTQLGLSLLVALAPFIAFVLILGVVGNVALGGWVLSMKNAAPKFDKINPVKGIKKMFSSQQLIELIKSLIKATIIVVPLAFILEGKFFGFMSEKFSFGTKEFIGIVISDVFFTTLALSCLFVILVVIDVPFQIYNHAKQLKMSKQEIKDEYKNTEGNPEVKARRRSIMIETSMKARNSKIQDADILITNPTHFSVGVKYCPLSMSEPQIVALGADHIALALRVKAKEFKIPILEIPPLARVLYKTCNVGGSIPEDLFQPMAIVLNEVYSLNNRLDYVVTSELIDRLKIDEDKF
ncbi:flagellar biosynthesis protein FlhB [Vibrio alginolyticus]|uniref:EscU/YscU/HrcU family type III secretion system export apparatus switch protein n=1 Tax=Vibrio alginolyticus TaxID=663 RepID=UPI0006CA6070|nr:flagellar type III secretion system protein FlhB [Vibrio alginolyticus]CAH7157530.1 Flagellar biosynthesis protein FlhB [Vibrio chagasii]CAH7327209.1 Flagellar biosynthesis protein FlhB [Vibrio chagasii]